MSIAVVSAQGVAVSPDSSKSRPQVLVLGVFHMTNPDLDFADPHVNDVLTPKRQKQIKKVVSVLKRFKPTKIAVEVRPGNSQLLQNYARYIAGKDTLTRSEIQQLGFRLAKELGLKTVYEVDAPREFPFKPVKKFAKSTGRSKKLKALMNAISRHGKKISNYLATHTILQTLIYMNSNNYVTKSKSFYYKTAHFSKPGNWAGADLVAAWYKRNIRIYANVVHLIDSNQDRILVIFGAGHLGWLRHDFANDPTIHLRKLSDFVH
jgi:hypothetical protein